MKELIAARLCWAVVRPLVVQLQNSDKPAYLIDELLELAGDAMYAEAWQDVDDSDVVYANDAWTAHKESGTFSG